MKFPTLQSALDFLNDKDGIQEEIEKEFLCPLICNAFELIVIDAHRLARISRKTLGDYLFLTINPKQDISKKEFINKCHKTASRKYLLDSEYCFEVGDGGKFHCHFLLHKKPEKLASDVTKQEKKSWEKLCNSTEDFEKDGNNCFFYRIWAKEPNLIPRYLEKMGPKKINKATQDFRKEYKLDNLYRHKGQS